MNITLTLYDPAKKMPDADTDVLVWDASSDEGQLGAYVGHGDDGAPLWVGAGGEFIDTPLYWAEMPRKRTQGQPLVYISGPMTGLPGLNFPAFHAAAAQLRSLGFAAVNPAEINPDSGMSWHECMRADIRALCDCDALTMLPGWEASNGAHLEVHLAHRLGLKIGSLADIAVHLENLPVKAA